MVLRMKWSNNRSHCRNYERRSRHNSLAFANATAWCTQSQICHVSVLLGRSYCILQVKRTEEVEVGSMCERLLKFFAADDGVLGGGVPLPLSLSVYVSLGVVLCVFLCVYTYIYIYVYVCVSACMCVCERRVCGGGETLSASDCVTVCVLCVCVCVCVGCVCVCVCVSVCCVYVCVCVVCVCVLCVWLCLWVFARPLPSLSLVFGGTRLRGNRNRGNRSERF